MGRKRTKYVPLTFPPCIILGISDVVYGERMKDNKYKLFIYWLIRLCKSYIFEFTISIFSPFCSLPPAHNEFIIYMGITLKMKLQSVCHIKGVNSLGRLGVKSKQTPQYFPMVISHSVSIIFLGLLPSKRNHME